MIQSIVNGTLEHRREIRRTLRLTKNPFSKTEPSPEVAALFVGREVELRRAAVAVAEERNVLVLGGYGSGKTTFAKMLLGEIDQSHNLKFCSDYAAARAPTAEGLQLAALQALSQGVLRIPSASIDDGATAARVRDELVRLTGAPAGNPAFLFEELARSLKREEDRRFVLAIDELDKTDSATLKAALVGSRPTLDAPGVSFIILARPSAALADAASAVNAAFDTRIDLRPFSAEDLREILRRALGLARGSQGSADLSPLSEELVNALIGRSKGIPRTLHLLAHAAIEQAIEEAAKVAPGQRSVEVTRDHLERALQREGMDLLRSLDADDRRALASVFAAGGSLPEVVVMERDPAAPRRLEVLVTRDALVSSPSSEGPVYSVAPSTERALASVRQLRDELAALWRAALRAQESEMGRALEAFAEPFFSEHFKVIDRNLRTQTSEIELVLEASASTDQRFRRATYLIVECKNWSKQRVDKREVAALAGEMLARDVEQAFLLTTGEVTEDAQQHARDIFDKKQILILDGARVTQFLESDELFVGDFLARVHEEAALRVRRPPRRL